jgi:hypothetical protein
MSTTTPIQSLPVPESTDTPNIPGNLMTLAQAIENKLVMRFASVTARNSAIPTPIDGMVAYVEDIGEMQVYEDAAWRTFFTAKDPGSGISRGHVSSFQSAFPSDARPGHVALDRDTGQSYVRTSGGAWAPVGAAKVMAFGNTDISAPGTATSEGTSSQSVAFSITTTAPNTDLHIDGTGKYDLMGVGVFGGVYGGWQDVAVSLNVTPPGGSLTEIKRQTNREMNTGGTGSTTVGGPTPRHQRVHWVYRCVTAGTYTFAVRVHCGSGGQGSVNNRGGDLTISPIVRVTTF